MRKILTIIKQMKTLFKDIKIPALKGKRTIARSELFEYLDTDFENWGTDKVGEETEEAKIAVLEMTEDGTFKDIFKDPERMAMSQDQILWLVENQMEKLKDGSSTFFLFKAGSELFVAGVSVDSGRLEVRVSRFSCDDVWGAEYRDRVVVPQLALDPSEPSPSEALTLGDAIQKVKEAGYLVFEAK